MPLPGPLPLMKGGTSPGSPNTERDTWINLPPAAVVPPDVASPRLSGVGGDLSIALNTGSTSVAGPSNSGPPSESTVSPIAPQAKDVPPNSGAPLSETASHDTQVPDSSMGTAGSADNGNTQVDDGSDTIMVDPDLQLAASVPLPPGDDGL
ncbi:uncharacterized protein EV420DRAFT_1653419 [Desarmillaria tabescens]|uniref:Uncharacterized protein n=1 Tax=Armillaria tabescens TaxID=1929756 RepID=A0AA39J444_ARMTA|nr:uncharacterized protein EV420DRAFT_1653419 [Desarmillaria tabescens]KAK0435120.1 hypothetical protein EV420DRAFT_1653419 [Desarmillaria tabescens]